MFFKGSAGAFLVFDLGNKKSFENLDKWFEVMDNSIDTPVVSTLIGNKCDLPNREVTDTEAREWAQQKGLNYLEVSAKTGKGVVEAFSLMASKVYELK